MVKFIAGGKGEGKTKKIIALANESVKTNDGHLVYIDDDRRHIYDLHYDIRFVETGSFPLSNYREFIGFVCGIMSQDNDIKEIYVDGLNNVVKNLNIEDLLKLAKKLESLSSENGLDFIISITYKKEELPEEVAALLI